MTTIAWDGKTLAVDSQATRGATIIAPCTKIFSNETCAFAGCGEWQDMEVVWKWLISEQKQENKPSLSDDGIDGIFIKEGEAYHIEDKLRSVPITESIAYGSGGRWAIAAMDFDLNAQEAVEYAAARDIYTGGKVDVWSLPTTGNSNE